MRRRHPFILAAGVLGLLLFGIAWFAAQQLAAREREQHAATTQTASLRKEIERSRVALTEAERAHAALIAQASTTASANPASTAPAAAKPAPRPKPPGLIEMSRQHPELWNAFIASQGAQIGKMYGAFFQKLGLNDEQVARFKAIKVADGGRSADLAAAADIQGLKWDDPVYVKLREDSKRQLVADETAFLGETGYRQLDDYEHTLQARGLAHGLAAALAFSDPLSGSQAEQLTQAIAQACPAYRGGQFADMRNIDWIAVDRQARIILSPSQYAVWLRGDAHDTSIGSRASLILEDAYDQAEKRDREQAKAAPVPAP